MWRVSVSSEGLLPLHVACLYSSQGCVDVLLDVMSSSQVKHLDQFHRSPLHAAALAGYIIIIIIIIIINFNVTSDKTQMKLQLQL